jgi:hypothetical protein
MGQMTMAKFFQIDGVKIEVVEAAVTTDPRFFAQRTLIRMNTAEARAELARRAQIINARKEG